MVVIANLQLFYHVFGVIYRCSLHYEMWDLCVSIFLILICLLINYREDVALLFMTATPHSNRSQVDYLKDPQNT